jgi:Carboxypeptidase regulatory-like domain
MRFLALTILAAVLCFVDAAEGQIMEGRQINGKTVMCMHSGLTSDLKDCGARSFWYAYVFVGSISAITPAENDEKEIQIIPEEVFHGNPARPLTVITSQGTCLPKLEVGDRWLFFLRQEKDKPIVLDYYGNDSIPVGDAQEQIETLRRLKNIGNFGIVRGTVMQGRSFDGKTVPNAHVVARRESDGAQFVTSSDADGRYEFEPLAPGEYKITVDPVGSYRPDDAGAHVSGGACWNVTLSRSPHGRIGGHVRHADGSPVPNIGVVIMGADNSWFIKHPADAHGYFSFDSLEPGQYVIGIDLLGGSTSAFGSGAGPAWVPPTASVYYGGATDRSGALVITLAADEKRDDFDFIAPPQ